MITFGKSRLGQETSRLYCVVQSVLYWRFTVVLRISTLDTQKRRYVYMWDCQSNTVSDRLLMFCMFRLTCTHHTREYLHCSQCTLARQVCLWVRLRPGVDDVRGWLVLSAGLLAGGGGYLFLASATADPCEVPNLVAVTTGEVKCRALLSTTLVVCGTAPRTGATWWALLRICWEGITDCLDGRVVTRGTCDILHAVAWPPLGLCT